MLDARRLHELIHQDEVGEEDVRRALKKEISGSELLVLLMGIVVKGVLWKRHQIGGALCARCEGTIRLALLELEKRMGEPIAEQLEAALRGKPAPMDLRGPSGGMVN